MSGMPADRKTCQTMLHLALLPTAFIKVVKTLGIIDGATPSHVLHTQAETLLWLI